MFGKICLKSVGDIFFQYVICNQERDGVRKKKKKILKSMLGLNTVIILKRMRESIFSLKATNVQHVRLEMETRWQNL